MDTSSSPSGRGFERIRRFKVMPKPFTIESGLMAPTMKLKRQAIYREYAETIAELYKRRAGSIGTAIWRLLSGRIEFDPIDPHHDHICYDATSAMFFRHYPLFEADL